jgi:hypothetical protein
VGEPGTRACVPEAVHLRLVRERAIEGQLRTRVRDGARQAERLLVGPDGTAPRPQVDATAEQAQSEIQLDEDRQRPARAAKLRPQALEAGVAVDDHPDRLPRVMQLMDGREVRRLVRRVGEEEVVPNPS